MEIFKRHKKPSLALLSFVFILVIAFLVFLLISISLEKELNEKTTENQEQENIINYYENENLNEENQDLNQEMNQEMNQEAQIETLKINRENYLRENISALSPEPEVLGGTFYVTEITWLNQELALVNYEDGHIALSAEALFSEDSFNLEPMRFSVQD